MSFVKPGVYTSYTLVPTVGVTSQSVIGVVVEGTTTSEVECITSLLQAKEVFGESGLVVSYLQGIFSHATVTVYAMTAKESDYVTAWETVLEKPITVLCTDSTDSTLLKQLASTLKQLASEGKPVLGMVGETAVNRAKTLAQAINCERVCVTAPAVVGQTEENVAPAVLAGLLASNTDLSSNLNGAMLSTLYHVEDTLSTENIQKLMGAGVCVFQQSGSFAELLRGMTSKTTDADGNLDRSFQNVSVVLIADTVVTQVQRVLTSHLLGQGNGAVTLEAVLSLVVCALEDFVELSVLTSYDPPQLWLDEEDASLCHVSLAFTVQQGIYQVYLHAMVNV